MPPTEVVIYREGSGNVPFLEWLATLPPKAQDKSAAWVGMLRESSFDLKCPHADDGPAAQKVKPADRE